MKTPYSISYRVGDTKLDTIESVGPFNGPLSALRHFAEDNGWRIDHESISGKAFKGRTHRGEIVAGSVYPSASTPHVGASL